MIGRPRAAADTAVAFASESTEYADMTVLGKVRLA